MAWEKEFQKFTLEWSEAKTDQQRFEVLKKYQHVGIILYLDNDCMFIGHEADENGDMEDQMNTCFNGYIGWNESAIALCTAYGIQAKIV